MPDAGEHTPGPWEWDENVHGIHITKPRDGTIPLTVARIAGSNDESLANARLIAAAPELLAELAAMKARGDRLAEAFLETREMLGLAEQAVCEECCPTTWKTVDGRPHCKLHEDIRAVLFKHEATRDQALTEWRDQ